MPPSVCCGGGRRMCPPRSLRDGGPCGPRVPSDCAEPRPTLPSPPTGLLRSPVAASRVLGAETSIAPKLPPSLLLLSLYPPQCVYGERSDPPSQRRMKITPNAGHGRHPPSALAGGEGARDPPPGDPRRWQSDTGSPASARRCPRTSPRSRSAGGSRAPGKGLPGARAAGAVRARASCVPRPPARGTAGTGGSRPPGDVRGAGGAAGAPRGRALRGPRRRSGAPPSAPDLRRSPAGRGLSPPRVGGRWDPRGPGGRPRLSPAPPRSRPHSLPGRSLQRVPSTPPPPSMRRKKRVAEKSRRQRTSPSRWP